MKRHSRQYPARYGASALALFLAVTAPAGAGGLDVFMGTGLGFGYAARFQPYRFTQNVNYQPHLGLALTPRKDWKYEFAWMAVDARSLCFLCGSRLTEEYARFSLKASRSIHRDGPVEAFLGLDAIRQTGRNRYTLVHQGLPDGTSYHGALVDRYELIGGGGSAEVSLAGFLAGGVRFGYAWLRGRSRTNTLAESLGAGDESRPIPVAAEDRGSPYTLETYLRLSLAPIRW